MRKHEIKFFQPDKTDLVIWAWKCSCGAEKLVNMRRNGAAMTANRHLREAKGEKK